MEWGEFEIIRYFNTEIQVFILICPLKLLLLQISVQLIERMCVIK